MAERLEFSEFTFGFALTENLGRLASVKGVPVFPSLIDEGKKGGGYDVALKVGQGLPVLLQFKVPQVVTRRSSLLPHGFPRPYYRAHLRCRVNDEGYSQHSVLLEHERNGYDVYYATPRFHRITNLDQLFLSGGVVAASAFFTPIDVGDLTDMPHHVAYCDSLSDGWLRSDPIKMPHSLTGEVFLSRLSKRIATRQVRTYDPVELLESMVDAAERGIAKANEAGVGKLRIRRDDDGPRRRLPPREFAAQLRDGRSPRQAAALFARLWLSAELIEVTRS